MSRFGWFPVLVLAVGAGCQHRPAFEARNLPVTVNGEPAVSLRRTSTADGGRPRMIEAQILPGRGMNIYQIRAWIPGRGAMNLLYSPPVAEAPKAMPDSLERDPFGNASFAYGGAILAPFANRIRGHLSAGGKTIETSIAGHAEALPANFHGKNAGAEVHAIHGLILRAPFTGIKTSANGEEASASGTLDAGGFDGRWPSATRLSITATLREHSFGFTVTAENTGRQPLPMGIGWHPYFVLPSGKREQARLHVPAQQRTLIDNYDNVFPTGQVAPVAGTQFDFSAPTGAALGKLYLDDCFLTLQKDAHGASVAEIIDPAARYGLRIRSLSPQITAYQVYAPVDKAFVALEPQFNLADPFSRIWNGRQTGMVMLKPGERVRYSVEVEPFVP